MILTVATYIRLTMQPLLVNNFPELLPLDLSLRRDINHRDGVCVCVFLFSQVHSSSGHKHSLKEVLADPAASVRLADTKVSIYHNSI